MLSQTITHSSRSDHSLVCSILELAVASMDDEQFRRFRQSLFEYYEGLPVFDRPQNWVQIRVDLQREDQKRRRGILKAVTR